MLIECLFCTFNSVSRYTHFKNTNRRRHVEQNCLVFIAILLTSKLKYPSIFFMHQFDRYFLQRRELKEKGHAILRVCHNEKLSMFNGFIKYIYQKGHFLYHYFILILPDTFSTDLFRKYIFDKPCFVLCILNFLILNIIIDKDIKITDISGSEESIIFVGQ